MIVVGIIACVLLAAILAVLLAIYFAPEPTEPALEEPVIEIPDHAELVPEPSHPPEPTEPLTPKQRVQRRPMGSGRFSASLGSQAGLFQG